MRGVVYDGLTARGRAAAVEVEGDELRLRFDDGEADALGARSLRIAPSGGARFTVLDRERPDWRLIVAGAPPAAWTAALRSAHAIEPRTAARWGAGVAAVAVAAGLLWLFGAPLLGAAAPLVPHEVGAAIGADMARSITGDSDCENGAGQAALGRLVARLRPTGGFVEPVTVQVVDRPIVNAVTVPGGRILIFSRLVQAARTPDEVAGVLAHELAHVQRRHPTRALLRYFGVSLLAGAIGGDVGQFADLAILLQGSRAAEAEADRGAIDLLRAAHVSPVAVADFFDRHRAEQRTKRASQGDVDQTLGRLTDYAATHPDEGGRAAAFRAAAAAAGPTTPALTDADWVALRAICRDG